MSPRVLLEVCADSLESVRAAEAGGADRLELCQGLSEGGTTPSAGFLERARASTSLPLFVLLRPRAGDFRYTSEEVRAVLRDLEVARDLGADGLVAGALSMNGGLDEEFVERVVAAAGPLPVTFHRAFDLCADPLNTLDRLIELGVTRVLSSGQAARLEDGLELLAEMTERAGERLVVMPGGGLREETVTEVVRRTGARELHGSASVLHTDGTSEALEGAFAGRRVTDSARVARLRELANAT